MPLSTPLIAIFAATLLLLWCAALWLLQPSAARPSLKQRLHRRGLRLVALSLALFSLLLLCACGTVPSPASTPRPVPAALLVPPKAPTLLQPKLVPEAPASASKTPGTTTPPTPAPARPTASATSA